ncbi:hypothetical protein Rumeso_04732 [Rubellimicrobium mesophilum DSM 19309]|uniref:Phage head-tail adaptor n=1 Tax=Rubellimicrobium mesophilum DSM 19309 TaxID=442562 RepID=A0A017HGZ1_9RHOB|nr:hypothetical protein Rumeso_04732 [Rubellimicrobium mesophilum DSM 19309]
MERSTAEFLEDGGAADNGTIVFRTRPFGDLTTADRIAFQGALWNVREVRLIGRREGLEIRCVNVNGAG